MSESINGLYVGMLTPEEMAWFEQQIAEGKAARDYSGPGGIFGLAKVKITNTSK